MNRGQKTKTASNSPSTYSGGITVKSPQELDSMRRAGAIVGAVIDLLKAAVAPGVTTLDLDKIAYKEITRQGARPTFMGYQGFPASICTSVNEEIVHGIPGKRILNEGDIVGIDIGAIVEGYHGDSAFTWAVGEVGEFNNALLEAGEGSLHAAFPYCKVGHRIGDLSSAVQEYAESRGFSVVREYVGHGIGRMLHEEPSVPNYGAPGKGLPLRKGCGEAFHRHGGVAGGA